MYVVAGLNTGTEYYRAKYQSHNTRGDDIKVDIPEPLVITKVEEICQ